MNATLSPPVTRPPARTPWILLLAASIVFAILVGLGTWQVQRLHWKEALLETIHRRVTARPVPLQDIEARAARGEDIDYWPVELQGKFLNGSERHFFATHDGQTGFFVYTPLQLSDGRVILVNRGFVPYDKKEQAARPGSTVDGETSVVGLSRNRLAEKPSWVVPDNDLAKNIFYWKDLDAMAGTAGLPAGATIVPFFIDADATPNPGGLPVGGVTNIDLPNSHLQYAMTWYGLAAALVGVVAVWLAGRRKGKAIAART